MMLRHGWAGAVLIILALLAGCSGGSGPPGAGPPAAGGDAGVVRVGPMLVRIASTAHFTTTHIPCSDGTCSFVAVHGARIDHLAAQALLDRVLFSSDRDGYFDIWVSNLDGGNPVQLTNNTASDERPAWSPDGTRIAFQRQWPGLDTEIIVMNADGSSIHALTANNLSDQAPTWSPDGRRLAFASNPPCSYDIYSVYADGTGLDNLTNAVGNDTDPDWSRSLTSPQILFSSTRDINIEIYKMDADGGNQTRLTNDTVTDMEPAWSPNGSEYAYRSNRGNHEIMVAGVWSGALRNFSNHSADDEVPDWSSDGSYIAFGTWRGFNWEVYLQQTDDPWRSFNITDHAADDTDPDLGGRTMQSERVLIGPPGSDWGGMDPIWADAPAGIVAFGPEGYVNFVRIGVRAADTDTLEVTPLEDAGWQLAGAVIEAAEIVNLKEDAGRGVEPTTWYLDPLNPGAVAVYFNVYTGNIVSVLPVRDAAYPSGVGPAGLIRQRVEGGQLLIEGSFSAVFDGAGHRVADAASAVTISADGGIDAR